jgi:hypothetical protein
MNKEQLQKELESIRWTLRYGLGMMTRERALKMAKRAEIIRKALNS